MASSADALPDAPYSHELLADLHAGVLSESLSSRLWPLVRRDPDAMKVIDALDSVTQHLRDIGQDLDGTAPVPPEVVERIDRLLDAPNAAVQNAAPPIPNFSVTSAARGPDVARGRSDAVLPMRRRRVTIVLGIAAAAAVLAVAAVGVSMSSLRGDAEPATAQQQLVLDTGEFDSGVAFAVIGRRDSGALSDPAVLASCLEANAFDPETTVLGSGSVEVDGREGTLLVLPGAAPSELVALAVGNDCGLGNPDLLTRRAIG